MNRVGLTTFVTSAAHWSPGQALPPPTGTAAWSSIPPAPFTPVGPLRLLLRGASTRCPARPRRRPSISHVIPLWFVQIVNLHRWNCNVFGVSRKVSTINYVRNLGGGGVGGFNVAMLSRLVREKVRPAWPDVCVSAKKFALHAQNTPKLAFLRLLGELFRGNVAGGGVLGEFFRGNAAGGAVLGEFFRDPAAVGARGRTLSRRSPGSWAPLLAVLTLRCAAKPYGWRGGQPAQATTHQVNVRMKGPRPPALGLSAAAGCNVLRLGVARKRSGVMCGWLCSRVRTVAPRPNPGGALPQPTIRRSAVLPAWRT